MGLIKRKSNQNSRSFKKAKLIYPGRSVTSVRNHVLSCQRCSKNHLPRPRGNNPDNLLSTAIHSSNLQSRATPPFSDLFHVLVPFPHTHNVENIVLQTSWLIKCFENITRRREARTPFCRKDKRINCLSQTFLHIIVDSV